MDQPSIKELLSGLESDVAVLRDFEHTSYFAVLSKYWDAMLEDKKTRVLTATKDTFEYWQGVYNGSRDVILLLDALRKEADRMKEVASASRK